MRIVLQRVTSASVEVEGETVAAIDAGFLVLVGVTHSDTETDAEVLARKVARLRLFPNVDDPDRKPIDAGLETVDGAVLAVSQFTLYGNTSRGRRPSFVDAAPSETALPIFDRFVATLCELGVRVETGIFGTPMRVALVNDGPATLILEQP